MANAGANEQGVLCVRFVATRDEGEAADARADVPELVLAAKHAPGCAAALVCATFTGLEMWGGGGICARADLTVGVVVVVLRVEDAGGGAVQAVAGRPLARHHHPHTVVQPPGALAEQAAGGAESGRPRGSSQADRAERGACERTCRGRGRSWGWR